MDRSDAVRRGYRRWIALVLAPCLGLGAGLWPAGAVALPSGFVLVKAERSILIYSSISRMCVGDEGEADAQILLVLTYKDAAGHTQTMGRASGSVETIGATSGDPAVADVSPSTGHQAATGVRSGAKFTISAKRAGSMSITFSDAGLRQAAPQTLTVEVVDCHYEVTLSATWRFTTGFKPTAHASLTKVALLPTGILGTYLGGGILANSATAPPYRNCVVTFAVDASAVIVGASPDAKHPKQLIITLGFDPLPKPVVEVCHYPYVSGAGSGSGKPRPVTLTIDTQATSTTKIVPQVLDASEKLTSQTVITVTKVPN